MPVSQVHVVSAINRKVRVLWYWGTAGIETMYLFKWPRTIRIYDKARERNVDVPPHWTRVEAAVASTGMAPHQLLALPNPFARVKLVAVDAVNGGLIEQLLAREAGLYGLAAVLQGLDKSQRAQFLGATKPAPYMPSLQAVFDAKWTRVVSTQLSRLGL